MNEFRKHGTLIVVSHDLHSVKALCDRVLWLDQGKAKALGPAKDICETYLSDMFDGTSHFPKIQIDVKIDDLADQRLPFLNASNLRNDLEVFNFDPNAASYGSGGAQITNVRLIDQDGHPYHWIVGGELVTLSAQVKAHNELTSPIIGFFVKNSIGQALFGDNTYLTYMDAPLAARTGDELEARFLFRMPRLPVGEYSVTVAVAEGTQGTHHFHHWVHDALVFQSRRSSVGGELVGLPMVKITFDVTSCQPKTRE